MHNFLLTFCMIFVLILSFTTEPGNKSSHFLKVASKGKTKQNNPPPKKTKKKEKERKKRKHV